MNFLTLDLETSSEVWKKRVGSPWKNEVLCTGLKGKSSLDPVLDLQSFVGKPYPRYLNGVSLLIGHNIKYDLLYIWRDRELQDKLREGLQIFDTQLAEFILSGQQYKYPSLRDIAVKTYGQPYRDKLLEQYKIGKTLDTTKVPIEELLIDVKNDVIDTEAVALKQVKLLKEQGMYNLAKTQFDAVLATTEMEFNGMYIDKDVLKKNKEELELQLLFVSQHANIIINKYWANSMITGDEFNLSSNDQLSILLFGGDIKIQTRELVGKYKNGKDKYKNIERNLNIPGLKIKPLDSWQSKKEGIYFTNEAVLKHLVMYNKDLEVQKLCEYILEIRGLDKQINTYYNSIEVLIHDWDSCVHGEFSHCGYDKGNDEWGGGTDTGRLSSRNPNLQNFPRSTICNKVKQYFTSRHGSNGVIIEFDYKLLEVCVFAFLTQDCQLLNDLDAEVDIYVEVACQVYGISPEEISKDQRQLVKRAVLALIYGAGVKRISKTLDIDEELATDVKRVFYDRYPMAKQWQDNLIHEVESNKYLISEYTPKGNQKHESYYKSISGRKYLFQTLDAPQFLCDKGVLTGFNPPEIKNYPVQGLATADIVLMKLGQLWRKAINHRDKFLLINTVHDSIIIDCKKEFVEEACNLIKNELECIQEPMKKIFNIDWNVNLKVDIKQGNSWYDCGINS